MEIDKPIARLQIGDMGASGIERDWSPAGLALDYENRCSVNHRRARSVLEDVLRSAPKK